MPESLAATAAQLVRALGRATPGAETIANGTAPLRKSLSH